MNIQKNAVNQDSSLEKWRNVLIFPLLFLLYRAVCFWTVRENHWSSFPFQQDDYLFFLEGIKSFVVKGPRPVSMLLIGLLGEFGMRWSYAFLHVYVVIYVYLVLLFVFKLFRVKLSFQAAIVAGVLSFSLEYVPGYTKYLGGLTNVWSSLLGTSALYLSLVGRDALTENTKKLSYLCSIGLFFLTCFAKEDFILPYLACITYLAIFDFPGKFSWRGKYIEQIACSLSYGIAAFCLYFNKVIISSPYLSEENSYYKIDVGLRSILKTWNSSLSFSSLSKFVFFSALVGLLLAITLKRQYRLLLVSLAGFLVLLRVPYMVLPNRMSAYLLYCWYPWEAVSLVFITFWFLKDTLEGSANLRILKNVLGMVLVVVAFGIAHRWAPERDANLNWHLQNANVNRNEIETLVNAKQELAQYKDVGIVGAEYVNPWIYGSGTLYLNMLGVSNQWLVFVHPESEVAHTTPTWAAHGPIYPIVKDISELESFKNKIPVVYFNGQGIGRIEYPKLNSSDRI